MKFGKKKKTIALLIIASLGVAILIAVALFFTFSIFNSKIETSFNGKDAETFDLLNDESGQGDARSNSNGNAGHSEKRLQHSTPSAGGSFEMRYDSFDPWSDSVMPDAKDLTLYLTPNHHPYWDKPEEVHSSASGSASGSGSGGHYESSGEYEMEILIEETHPERKCDRFVKAGNAVFEM